VFPGRCRNETLVVLDPRINSAGPVRIVQEKVNRNDRILFRPLRKREEVLALRVVLAVDDQVMSYQGVVARDDPDGNLAIVRAHRRAPVLAVHLKT
jgi:hypothetical protein